MDLAKNSGFTSWGFTSWGYYKLNWNKTSNQMMVSGERKPEYPGKSLSEPTLLLHTTNA